MPKQVNKLAANITLLKDSQVLASAQHITLLTQIQACGSITQAAKQCDISYKTAWDLIDRLNNLSGQPLVARLTGGKGGGGSALTEKGLELVESYNKINQLQQRFIQQLNAMTGSAVDHYGLLRRMTMATSARNQLLGTVSKMQRGAVNDQITVDIGTEQSIVAIVTHESTEALNLKLDDEVVVLVKSSSIILVSGDEVCCQYSARNQFMGKVKRVQPGAVNSQVCLDIGRNKTLTAIITSESSDQMQLKAGDKVKALFKASSVILGIPA